MTEILNLALKKNIFEKVINGETDEIPIKKNDWWRKRLMDVDTGCFKKFDIASITSGSPDKTNYEINHIELRGDYFIVTIKKGPVNMETEETPVEKEVPVQTVVAPKPEPVKTEPVVIESIPVKTEPVKPEPVKKEEPTEKPTKQVKSDTPTIKATIWKVFEKFCQLKDVYVVNMPSVTIRNNGQIFGCSKRLIADRDSDVKFEFRKEEIIQNFGMSDEVFLGEIIAYLDSLLKNNYVFVNKNRCGFATGTDFEIIFKMTVIAKRKYLFQK
jgi:hypothetical protein